MVYTKGIDAWLKGLTRGPVLSFVHQHEDWKELINSGVVPCPGCGLTKGRHANYCDLRYFNYTVVGGAVRAEEKASKEVRDTPTTEPHTKRT